MKSFSVKIKCLNLEYLAIGKNSFDVLFRELERYGLLSGVVVKKFN